MPVTPSGDQQVHNPAEDPDAFETAVAELGLPTRLIEDESQLVLNLWEGAGIDTSDPRVQDLARDPAIQEAFSKNDARFATLTANLRTRYPAIQAATYSQALEGYGFAGVSVPGKIEPGVTTPSELSGGFGAPGVGRGAVGLPPSYERDNYVTNDDTGALLYRNGVIANPETGEVIMPPNADVAGSALWAKNASENWSDAKVTEWKKRLVDYGFLPKEEAKGTTWTGAFQAALIAYHKARYLNYGKPLQQSSAGAGAGAAGTFQDLHKIRASISNSVLAQYKTVFGSDPTPDELQSWTNFVIREGNKLQRGPHGLASGAAATEAGARATQRLYQSPEATLQREAEEENTSLNDALTTAIAATRGLA